MSAPCEHKVARCANCKGPHPATSPRCPEKRLSRQTRQQKEVELRSSPPAMGPAAEEENFTMDGDQIEMVMTPADPDETIPTQVILMSLEMSTPEPSPRPTIELRPRAKFIAKAAQIFEPSDPTHISIDDGSDATLLQRHSCVNDSSAGGGLLLEDKGLESKPLKCSVELGFRVSIVESKPLLFSSRDLCLNELEIS